MNDDKYLTVAALTKYLKYKFDSDDNLRLVFLKGEISNFKPHTTGHYYFSIKDETSKINAIMFSTSTKRLTFEPTDGMKVLVTGRISIYEATGNYQIYIDDMIEDGVGSLYIAFEKLKEQLSKEGLFDPAHKKAIPKIPNRIGIITASTGAAIKDILSTIKRRYPIVETILFPSLVQGDAAALDIVRNIKLAEDYHLDVLIIGRGGGSIEDMWPFNEEIVARAIYNCSIPTISAVGHEVDFTISDFVADMRAPTPTGAAEMVVPNRTDLLKNLNNLNIRLNENMLKKVNYQKLYLDSLKGSFVIKSPTIIFENKKQRLDLVLERLNSNIGHNVELKRINLDNIIDKIRMINPLDVLKRGYTLTTKDNIIIKSINNIIKNDLISIKFYNGTANVLVKEVWEEKDGKERN